MVRGALEEISAAKSKDNDALVREFAAFLKTKFNITFSPDTVDGAASYTSPEKLVESALALLDADIKNKEELIGAENLNNFIRVQYLQHIDRLWLDHLENMEGLREAVHLRHYAQKNPLTEYKLEGFQIFDSMIDKIREEIASRVHLVRIQLAGDRTAQQRPASVSASHGSLGAFASGAFASGASSATRTDTALSGAAAPEKVTVVRTVPKVGRNEPCPCGSGKKYKHCHGRLGRTPRRATPHKPAVLFFCLCDDRLPPPAKALRRNAALFFANTKQQDRPGCHPLRRTRSLPSCSYCLLVMAAQTRRIQHEKCSAPSALCRTQALSFAARQKRR
jgi:hypothetical protein